jgi:hypothetical protein
MTNLSKIREALENAKSWIEFFHKHYCYDFLLADMAGLSDALADMDKLEAQPEAQPFIPAQRQYYAAKAMQGILSGDLQSDLPKQTVTQWAFEQADSMIEFERLEQSK